MLELYLTRLQFIEIENLIDLSDIIVHIVR
jgi:hypothetical protein